MKVLVTGANGFIGSAAMDTLARSGLAPIAGLREPTEQEVWPTIVLGDIAEPSDFNQLDLSEVDVIVHSAGRAHVLAERVDDPLVLFRRVNVTATLALAKRAAEAGVKRFVFLSSIGVNGGATSGVPFDETTSPAPHSHYAQSKWEAEKGLWQIASDTGLELVVLRPPLVIGSHAPGNLQRLLGSIYRGVPLPLAWVENQRSLIALENLVSFITACVKHPNAANQTFVISDNEDISTPDIVSCLAEGMDKKALLVPFPVWIMSLGATLINKQPMFTQLCGSLQVDSSKAINLLGWSPSISVKDALRTAGYEYMKRK